jgi:phenylalanyl-tRNA synthetase beta chain
LNDTDVPFAVEIEAPNDCPRYGARLLKNVTIGPSPWWLQRRLTAVGLRPINNIVDITNLVMLEYGQPLHAFDFNTIAGAKIVVRHAVAGEKFITLDGVERELDSEMLLICDGEKPVAIAGVMGGLNSEVSDTTTDVLLESACFNPVNIRRTARRLNMATDASYRFERGVDPEGILKAMERAVQFMVDIAGAEALPGGVDNYPTLREGISLKLRVRRTCDLLGIELTSGEIADILRSIEMSVEIRDADTLIVEPPSFRVDIEREIDLVEEVARLIGFNEIPSTLPAIDYV